MHSGANFLLAVLLATHLADVTVSTYSCVHPCSCRERLRNGNTMMLHLECGRDTYIREVPDWSGLMSAGKPIAITLYVDKLPELHRRDIPSGLPIVSIDIVGNTKVKPNVFHNVRESLTELQLHSHKLNLSRPLSILQGLTTLRRLVLINVSDEDLHLTSSVFAGLGLEKLVYLQITSSKIASIGPNVFKGLGAQELSLANNRLTRFPGLALQKVGNLRSLNLFRNKIKRLKNGDTNGLKLQWLGLASNELAEIQDDALNGLQDFLTTLQLNENKLTKVPTAALAPLKKLHKLDLSENTITNISKAFEGNYCLQELDMGDFETRSLEHVGPDAFDTGGRCLRYLNLFDTRLKEFPSEALRAIEAARHISITSNALTTLRAGALSGIYTWSLTLNAPLDTVEQGAFENMTFHPLALQLEGTRLTNLSFFYDYAAGTFVEIYVISSQLPCDCQLAGIRYNLKLHQLTSEAASTKDLTGRCLLDGRPQSMHRPQVLEVFSGCTNLTVLPLLEMSSGSDVSGASRAAFLLTLIGGTVLSSSFARNFST